MKTHRAGAEVLQLFSSKAPDRDAYTSTAGVGCGLCSRNMHRTFRNIKYTRDGV